MNYSLHDLHQSINDIYEQFDAGVMDYKEASELARRCAEAFLSTHPQEEAV
jgi:hypothetical protein